MKHLTILISTLAFFYGIHGCRSQDALSFGEVFNQAVKIHDSLSNESVREENFTRESFKSFDFQDFLPVNGDVDSSDFYVVAFDSNKNIVRVRHYEDRERIFNFQLHVFNYPTYIIFGLNFLHSKESADGNVFLPGFFVYDRGTKRIYFINTVLQNHILWSPIFPAFDMTGVSSISIINSSFYLTNVLHFNSEKLDYFTEILFEGDGTTIKKERLFYYNSKLPRDLVISEHLTFEEIDKFITNYKNEYIDALPCLDAAHRNFPLWIFYGRHERCW